jgi:hypothetical protein
MLRSTKDLRGYDILATDGEIGSVDDFYFDDEKWGVRYLVANTGGWLTGRRVLLSPMSLGGVDWENRRVQVNLTREQVKNSPGTETDSPVSRTWERDFHAYYGLPVYWGGGMMWGAAAFPGLVVVPPGGLEAAAGERPETPAEPEVDRGDPHLRSAIDVIGHAVQARDGDIGHVEDFLLDDEAWAIRYAAVDTVNWWPGKKVLVPIDLIDRVDWIETEIETGLSREEIRSAPEWDTRVPLTRAYEEQLAAYYAGPVRRQAA